MVKVLLNNLRRGETEIIEWMLDIQLGRRNLSPIQRIAIAEKYRSLYEKQAKENQIKAGNNYGVGKEKPLPNLVNPISTVDTTKKLAEVAGVGKEIYRMGAKILNSDNEEIKNAVLSGEMSINAGYKERRFRKMNRDTYNQMVEECTKFRLAVEECKDNIGIDWFKDFPLGCCQDASLMLALYLHRKGFGVAELVSGSKGRNSHAWLELDGLIIDITADQFKEGKEKVIISKKSEFHNAFKNDGNRTLYNQMLTGAYWGDEALFNAYDIISKKINEKKFLIK